MTVQECDRPIGQRLHLLVIGIGVPDKKGLVARALKAVGAKPDAQRPNRFTADAFAEGYIYGPLTDYVTPADVLDELQFIKKSIEARTSAEELADVVMVYYQGGESCGKDGHYFRTDESHHYPVLKYSGIACARLANFFADTPVAQVLLLDVARDGGAPAGADGDMIAHWPDDSHVGVLRTAWTGKGPAPVDTRLITVLQEQMRQAARLKELANGVQKAYKESSEKYPAMVQFDQRVPQDLAGLKIGK